MIIPAWQKIGQSTHLLAKVIGKKIVEETKNLNNIKATHTGTLDPMAEGVIIILTGEDRFKKENFSNWKKTYQFEILLGISTDSLDLLGLTTEIIDLKKYNKFQTSSSKKIIEKLKKIATNFIGSQIQSQPKFSSQRIDGKSGFDLAKTNKQFVTKVNKINIYSLKILDQHDIELTKLKKEIFKKLSSITGNFRQDKIKLDWKKTFSELEKLEIKTLPAIKLEAEVSKRTYIRALVRDIAQELKLPATTYSIIRTKNGKFSKNSCHLI